MKNRILESKHIVAIILCVLWIILFSISLFPDSKIQTWWLVGIAPVLLLLWYFIFDVEIFLFLTIFFVPLSVKLDLPAGFAVSFPSEIMAVLMILFLVLNSSTLRIPDRRIFFHPVFLLLLVQLAWMVITSALGEFPLVSFKHTFIQVLYFVVFYFLFLTRFDKTVNIARFYLFYSLGLIVPIINGAIWHSQYNFNQQASYYMPQPFFIEHTLYGAAIAFVIPILFYLVFFPNDFSLAKRNRGWLILLLIIITLAEFVAFSRAAWFSLLVLPLFLLVIKLHLRQWLLLTGFVIFFVVLLMNADPLLSIISRNEARSNRGDITEQFESVSNIRSDMSNLERINRWKCAIRMFEERPVTGFGPGSYQFVYGRFQIKDEMTRISTYHGEKGNAHSEYLGFLAETGLPGFLIYIFLVFTVLTTANRIIYRTRNGPLRMLTIAVILALLTFYCHTIFNGFVETDKIGSLYYGSLAAITALDVYFFRRNDA